MGNLGDMVSELEQDCATYKQENLDLEHQLDEVEGQLEEVTNDKNELQKFYFWVREVYPEIVKDYGCVKIIEEKANECS